MNDDMLCIRFIRSGVFLVDFFNTTFVLITYFIKINIILSLNRILYDFRGHKINFIAVKYFLFICKKFLFSSLCKWKTNLCDPTAASLLALFAFEFFALLTHELSRWMDLIFRPNRFYYTSQEGMLCNTMWI